MSKHHVFVTGGTGYIGQRLIPALVQRGHAVKALIRRGSGHKLPEYCAKVIGNALDRSTFERHTRPSDTFVHLVGVAHPGPGKAKQFREIDFVSIQESVSAAWSAGIRHFVYLSVAQTPDFMKEYVQVRAEGEKMIRESGMNATFVRPWYVLGPGHRWPYVFIPMYWIMERIPSTCEKALQLGLVTLRQMIDTLVHTIEHPPKGVRVVGVEEIKKPWS